MDTQTSITFRVPRVLTRLWTSRRRLGRALARQLVPNLGSVALVLVLLWATKAQAAPWNATATAPTWLNTTTVNYQGRLADSSGTPIDNTNPGLGMTFALYDSDSGGSPLWSETHANVPVSDGLFSVRLGSINALSTDLLSGDRWLGIQVGTDAEMTPRERLSAVPYAMQASLALTVPDGAIGSRHFAPSWYQDSNPSMVTTTSTTRVPTGVSVSFTCENDCTALILHRGLVQHAKINGRTDVIVEVDDEAVFRELGVPNVADSSSGSRFHAVLGFDFVNLSAGTHTVEVTFRCASVGTCYYYGDSGGNWEHLNVLVFAQP